MNTYTKGGRGATAANASFFAANVLAANVMDIRSFAAPKKSSGA